MRRAAVGVRPRELRSDTVVMQSLRFSKGPALRARQIVRMWAPTPRRRCPRKFVRNVTYKVTVKSDEVVTKGRQPGSLDTRIQDCPLNLSHPPCTHSVAACLLFKGLQVGHDFAPTGRQSSGYGIGSYESVTRLENDAPVYVSSRCFEPQNTVYGVGGSHLPLRQSCAYPFPHGLPTTCSDVTINLESHPTSSKCACAVWSRGAGGGMRAVFLTAST